MTGASTGASVRLGSSVAALGLALASAGLSGCATLIAEDEAAYPVTAAPSRPPSDSYIDVIVGTPTTPFLFVRQDHWERMGETEAARRARLVETDGDFPVPGGSRLSLRRSTAYRFYPVCDGEVVWTRVVPHYAGENASLAVTC